MKKKQINETVSYNGLNSLAEVLESCMDKYSSYQAITDKYNNIFMTYGELKEEMNNFASGLQALGVKKGDKISQLVILPIPEVELVQVDSLEDSERGANGFGSSGR